VLDCKPIIRIAIHSCHLAFSLTAISNGLLEGLAVNYVAHISFQDEVTINYNKLHADPQQGKTLDIVLKKVKHRLVENMSTATADALGLSRAILCNDTLVKKLEELEQTEMMYRGLVEHAKRVLKAFFDLLQVYKGIHNSESSLVPRITGFLDIVCCLVS
jgi:hypothetical protein